MRRVLAVGCVVALLVAGCGDDTADTTEGTVGSTTSAVVLGYGDDPVLDLWWDDCAARIWDACDALYVAAPAGSEYAGFAATCGDQIDGTEWCFIANAPRAGPKTPDPDDVARFIDAMNGVAEQAGPEKPGAPTTMAVDERPELDHLLDKISETGEQMRASQEEIIGDLIERDLEPTDLLRLQMELMQMQLQQDVISSGANKTSQGVATLFKNQ